LFEHGDAPAAETATRSADPNRRRGREQVAG
jgi:hypothetical protein